MSLPDLNQLLSDRSRLVIMVKLAASTTPLSFGDLLQEMGLTKGNLSSHLRKLEENQYIKVTKQFVERKPLTTYRATATGRKHLNDHLKGVEALIKQMQSATQTTT